MASETQETAGYPRNTQVMAGRVIVERLIVTAVAVFMLAVIVTGVPGRYHQLLTISTTANVLIGQLRPEEAGVLEDFGLPVHLYAAYFTISETIVVVVMAFTALVIAWNRPNYRLALLVSLLLAGGSMTITSLGLIGSRWQGLNVVFRAAFTGSLMPLFFLFPDGRFVPRWTRWLVAAWLVYTATWLIFPRLSPPFAFGRGLAGYDVPRIAWILIWIVSGVVAQVYRYLRISNTIQRQQTKWVVLGFVTLLLTFITGIVILTYNTYGQPGPLAVATRLAGPTAILIGALAMPLSIGVSVLRYRLWDIDILIRRTLIYSSLIAALALLYLSSVLILQGVVNSFISGSTPIVNVISTLAVAALFNPIRQWIRNVIDRRFYRQKYNAEKVLAAFNITLRNEVNQDRLTNSILEVVEETLQPTHLSVWINEPADPGQ